MQAQVAIGGGKNKEMTPERKINLMLENGINVFILRWKKVHEYRTSYFGFEILDFVKRRNGLNSVTFIPRLKKGELVFEPDENNVPVAYAADSPQNRDILAKTFYSAHFIIAGLITPTGTTRANVIQAEIEAMAVKFDIKKPLRTKVVGVYGTSVPVDKNGKALMNPLDRKPIAPPKLDPKLSVFGNEETLKAVTKPEAMPPEPEGHDQNPRPTPGRKLSVEECFMQAEADVYDYYKSLVAKLQKEQGKYWKSNKYYRDIIGTEIESRVKAVLVNNGHPEDVRLPEAPKAEKVQAPKTEPEPAKTA